MQCDRLEHGYSKFHPEIMNFFCLDAHKINKIVLKSVVFSKSFSDIVFKTKWYLDFKSEKAWSLQIFISF